MREKFQSLVFRFSLYINQQGEKNHTLITVRAITLSAYREKAGWSQRIHTLKLLSRVRLKDHPEIMLAK